VNFVKIKTTAVNDGFRLDINPGSITFKYYSKNYLDGPFRTFYAFSPLYVEEKYYENDV